jgi:la-related protein 1
MLCAGNSHASAFVAAGLHASIRSQIEFYFTARNLERDQYLRSLMDSDGWVPVAALLQFNRLKALTADEAAVREALGGSRQLQVSADATRVRSKNRPRRWVLQEAEPARHHPATSFHQNAGQHEAAGHMQ